MGLDGYFFGRLDWIDKSKRVDDKTLEMVWETSIDTPSELFTGINYNYYSPPDYFCWDSWCNDEPIMDDASMHDFNARERTEAFLEYAYEQAKHYKTNNVLLTLGMDFHYQAAHTWFKNIDKLMKQVKQMEAEEGLKVNMIYSTPSCYLKAINEAQSEGWSEKTDDFMPYASDPDSYWSGYFSSKPTSKRLMHEASQILQATRQISAGMHSMVSLKFTLS